MRIPSATYRVQLTADFPFDAARDLLPYLEALGVSDLYVSPVLQSRAGSMHGYDVTDPTRVRDELGGEDGLVRLSDEAHRRGMGLLLDVVPNHVAASVENPWWENVLRYGPASRHAATFDIDWEPARPGLAGKVLLPVLTSHYGEALEGGELKLALGEDGLGVTYGGLRLPLSPHSQATVLGWGLARLERTAGVASPAVLELAAIVDQLANAGPHAADQERAATTRLLRLVEQDATVREHVEARIRRWNGTVGDTRSFEPLDRLLDAQAYRVVHWPVADQEINYRRFFDVNDLVAVRAEDERVFADLLGTLIRLARSGIADGLRIDHVDGLHDPARFLARLRESVGPDTYIVAEKILARDEDLRPWPVQGSTGYELLNAVNDVFIDVDGLGRLEQLVSATGGGPLAFDDEVYAAKRLAITELFGGELRNLAQRLGRLAEQHRHGRDLTLTELGRALVGVTASLGVYRTYVDSLRVEPPDREAIERAVAEAFRRDPDAARATRFMRHVLLLDLPARAGPAQRALWLRFVMRWQQLASAAMAKGHEDTAFYRHVRLLSRNEVGGDPARPPITVPELHGRMAARAERWPHALSTSSTHDTKRGEDVRARIDVLAELPEETVRRFVSWRRWCEQQVGRAALGLGVDALLLLFETLVGAWPVLPDPAFGDRIAAYAVKAAREAKRETSWRRPNEDYEAALVAVARAIVDADTSEEERRELVMFAERVAFLGARVSLGQKLMTIGLPGVPDVYQGTELWDLSLVDPDNRRPVDFARRRELLDRLDAAAARDRRALLAELMESWRDGRVKLYVTATALRLRREQRHVYEAGPYVALEATGTQAQRVVAFGRAHDGDWIVTVVPRLSSSVDDWGDTFLTLPAGAPGAWSDAVSSATHRAEAGRLRVSDLFRDLPVALLTGTAS